MKNFESKRLSKSPPELGVGAEDVNNAAKDSIKSNSRFSQFSSLSG
jgi:hypothetical protein